jgi:AAHS family 4-hydroxybenzoate transporter-like MFS transporter
LLLLVALFAALPESPRFLARRSSEWPRLIALLKRFGHALPNDTSFIDTATSGESLSASTRELFMGGLARDTFGLWVSFFCCLGAIYLVFGWLPALLTSQGLNVYGASSGLAFYNFGGVLGIVIWAILMPSVGSRGLLVFGALACALSSVALLFVPAQTSGGSNALLILFIGINGLLANAVQTSMYALAAHVYPTEVRATGVAYSVTVGRIGGLLSSFLGGYIIRAGAVRYWQIVALAMVCVSVGLACVRNHYPAKAKFRGVQIHRTRE